ncbi:hypothetical protein [Streptomyces chattanoogensis]|uniref:hypothetical protein n=1 Tax=Streptomyces chattanoogensis TaxID=66876 RepID=UPI0036CC3813
MRGQLGLPCERRLYQPWTVAAWWCGAGVVAGTGYLIWCAMNAKTAPATNGQWRELDPALDVALAVAYAFIGLGGLHALFQWRRIAADRRRVKAAEHEVLGAGSPGGRT